MSSSASSPLTLQIRPATEADIPQIIEIQFSAFEGDPYQEALFPSDDYYSPETRQAAVDRTLKYWNTDPTARWMVCCSSSNTCESSSDSRSKSSSSSSSSSSKTHPASTSSSSLSPSNTHINSNIIIKNPQNTPSTTTTQFPQDRPILGFALWNIYAHPRPRSEWAQLPTVDWCSGRQAEIAQNFLSMNALLRQKIWQGRPYILLNLLCVHQRFQRRGVGMELVQWGIMEMERLGLAMYLEASQAGLGLYRKLGFREVDVGVVRAEEWDGDHDRRYIALVKDSAIRGKEEGGEEEEEEEEGEAEVKVGERA